MDERGSLDQTFVVVDVVDSLSLYDEMSVMRCFCCVLCVCVCYSPQCQGQRGGEPISENGVDF